MYTHVYTYTYTLIALQKKHSYIKNTEKYYHITFIFFKWMFKIKITKFKNTLNISENMISLFISRTCPCIARAKKLVVSEIDHIQ